MPYKDPEKRREASRRYYENHKEKCNERTKEYRQNNKDKMNEIARIWRQTPQGIKNRIIAHWKTYGLIHDNYEELYEHYISTERCDVCKKLFSNTFDRCMDHDHDTGFYRHILCRNCNTNDNWKNKVIQ